MAAEKSAPVPRMSADERREQVLGAAIRAFARSGYVGTSTDHVAREAGVSQPYVVRMFGTKLDLFLAVFERATDRIKDAFDQVLSDGPFDPESEDDWKRLGAAYTGLLADRDLLLVMMHGFAAGSEPSIGRQGRRCMGEIFELIRSTGCTPERAPGRHGRLRLRRGRPQRRRRRLTTRTPAQATPPTTASPRVTSPRGHPGGENRTVTVLPVAPAGRSTVSR